MAIKKDAAKAKISGPKKVPTKETVNTPISECTAENPIKCKYHGLKAFQDFMGQALAKVLNYHGSTSVGKLQGNKGFELYVPSSNFNLDKAHIESLASLAKDKGLKLDYFGLNDYGAHQFSFKKINSTKKTKKGGKPAIPDGGDVEESASDAPSTIHDIKGYSGVVVPYILSNKDIIDKASEKDAAWGEKYVKLWGDVYSASAREDGPAMQKGFEELKKTIAEGKKILGEDGESQEKVEEADLDDFLELGTTTPTKKQDPKTKDPFAELEDGTYEFEHAIDDFLETGSLEDKPSEGFTVEEIKDFLAKNGLTEKTKHGDMPFDEVVANWKGLIEDGKAPTGAKLEDQDLSVLMEFYDAAGPDNNVSQALWDKMVEKGIVEEGAKAEETTEGDSNAKPKPKEPTEADWGKASNLLKYIELFGYMNRHNTFKDFAKEALFIQGPGEKSALIPSLQKVFKSGIHTLAHEMGKDHPIVKTMVAAYKSHPDYDMTGLEDFSDHIPASKSPETAAPKGSSKPKVEKQSPQTESLDKGDMLAAPAEDMLKPLEHDETKFPKDLSKKALDAAIAKGKKAGGHGGLHTTIVEIDGKKYICKNGSGKKASIIRNGYTADMGYRAGGIHAPDAKLYEFEDGNVYKLSEFVEGERLIDVWKGADETKRDELRKELLKGFPLDVLFSNYDVLGTSPEESQSVTITGANGKPQKTHVAFDNIIVGKDGNVYRIDNDGAFAMSGTGGIKSSDGVSLTTPVEYEHWDKWADRQWIDDFRTMRRNEKNLGIFDRYSTADIFLSAGNIDLNNVVKNLKNPGIEKALAKPLFEMKQMTYRAVNLSLGGFKNNGFVSMVLDSSYEASKKGLRELCKLQVSWNNPGYGEYKAHWGKYQMKPFDEPEPQPPENPQKSIEEKFKNEQYTGDTIATVILNAAKTINHHGGVKQTDKEGNVLGNGTAMAKPDYDPNAGKIAEYEKIDRDKLAELAKSDKNAETLLDLYDTIAYSKQNGWKKPIGQVPTGLTIAAELPKGYKSPTEKKILENMAGAIAEYEKALEKYNKDDLPAYLARKDAHKKREEAKAKAAGGSLWHNFHHFADEFIKDGFNTDGIAHKVATAGIKPIENSMDSQKGSAYGTDAVKWKIREMIGLGYTIPQIEQMAKDGDLYNGSYYTNVISQYYKGNQEGLDKEMASQAMYGGLQMLKLENEISDLYDKKAGVIFLNRNISTIPKGLKAAEKKIYSDSSLTGWVSPHLDSAADCMQFEANHWGAKYKQVYAVPFSRVVCCGNNQTSSGGGFDYDSEQEYVGNLLYLPCWVYHGSQHLSWKGAIDKAKETDGMKSFLANMEKHLAVFNTL